MPAIDLERLEAAHCRVETAAAASVPFGVSSYRAVGGRAGSSE